MVPATALGGVVSIVGFPGSSADTESTCNAGDPSSLPGLGIPLEKDRLLLQYPWASLVARQ